MPYNAISLTYSAFSKTMLKATPHKDRLKHNMLVNRQDLSLKKIISYSTIYLTDKPIVKGEAL
jgi:hypothetical protein